MEADVLPLQPKSRANVVVAPIVVKIALIGCQSVQVCNQGLAFAPPDGGVRIKGYPVHQERLHVAKVDAQIIQDAKAMGIDLWRLTASRGKIGQTWQAEFIAGHHCGSNHD